MSPIISKLPIKILEIFMQLRVCHHTILKNSHIMKCKHLIDLLTNFSINNHPEATRSNVSMVLQSVLETWYTPVP